MTSNLLGISVSGLRVAQSQLGVTGHNIANANVEGFSRQRANIDTNPATQFGTGYIGNGANVASIERLVNGFVTEQLRVDTSLYHELDTYHENIGQIDRLLADPATGISATLGNFFNALQNAADDPSSVPARQLVIGESENLANKFNTLYQRLDSLAINTESAIQASVAGVNALTENIASFNQRISEASAGGNGPAPNDLLDQRDEAVRQLAELVSISAYEASDSQVNVVLANGQNLVVGNDARAIESRPGDRDPRVNDLFLRNGENAIPLSDVLSGGKLGGLLRFQRQAIDGVTRDLGRFAIVVEDNFNRVHESGVNLYNQYGDPMFAGVDNPGLAVERVTANRNNATSDAQLALNIADSAALTGEEYRLRVDNGGLFHIENIQTGEEVVSQVYDGNPPTELRFDGLALIIEGGNFSIGDEFILSPTRFASRDLTALIKDPRSLAFGSPVLTGAELGNRGSAQIGAGEVLSRIDNEGNVLPLLANPGAMAPPLLVEFTSPSRYSILDNSDPGNPVELSPPLRNLPFTPGRDNALFPSEIATQHIEMRGDLLGLPVGAMPTVNATPENGYPAEAFSFRQPASQAGITADSVTVQIPRNASARTAASLFNNIEGVSARAFSEAYISGTQNLTRADPLQISLNGESLIEYEFDAGLSALVVSSAVPDPATDTQAFNDYLVTRINENPALAGNGLRATISVDPLTGADRIQVLSEEGDDLQVVLTADAGGPDSIEISDGQNPAVFLQGQGTGNTAGLAVGGRVDLELPEGLEFEAFPRNSLLFGDTTVLDFVRSPYLGIQAVISGRPETGDRFTLDFNRDAGLDNRNVLALGDLQAAGTVDNGNATLNDGYNRLVENIGIDAAKARSNRDASKAVLDEVTTLRDSTSGVNLDEEASNLIKYEQMYSANAQVISVARDIFDRLINAF